MCYLYREAYPEVVVVDVQFAYNISKLVKLDNQRYVTLVSLLWGE